MRKVVLCNIHHVNSNIRIVKSNIIIFVNCNIIQLLNAMSSDAAFYIAFSHNVAFSAAVR